MDDIRLKKKEKAQKLRRAGYSYLEIADHPMVQVPRPTVVTWCQQVLLSPQGLIRHKRVTAEKLMAARAKAGAVHHAGKVRRKERARESAEDLGPLLESDRSKKSILATLYLAEGTKGDRSALTFGNSDPDIVRLFLKLLRECFNLDEQKFRCTLQARSGQNIPELEKFWSLVTGIPKEKFYGARIDTRGNGKLIRKPDYKGVCRIDYLSVDLLYEVLAIGRILTKGP